MEQIATGPIRSDHDLIARLGFTEKQASNWLGRTQTTMREEGVRPGQVIELRLFAHLVGRPVRDNKRIRGYVRRRYGEKAAAEVRKAFDLMAAPLQLELLQEIWVVLPDVRHMMGINALDRRKVADIDIKEDALIHLLKELLLLPAALTFMTGGPLDQRDLQEFFGEESISTRVPAIHFKRGSAVGSQSTSLLGDPLSNNAKMYYPTKQGWVRAPAASVTKFASWLADECD